MNLIEIWCNVMGSIGLVQDGDHWRALVNIVKNLWVM
jgi:hypothetical protein